MFTGDELEARGTAALPLERVDPPRGDLRRVDAPPVRQRHAGRDPRCRGVDADSTGALKIGGNAIWGEWFNGLIDEVRVYNRALSAAEIAADKDRGV